VNYIRMVEGSVQWRDFVIMVIKFLVPLNFVIKLVFYFSASEYATVLTFPLT
jgi:hypothetical protein